MPQVTDVHLRGRTVEVLFDDAPPLRCDRAFRLSQTFEAGQRIDAAILDRVRGRAARHDAEAAAMRWLKARPRGRSEIERRLRERKIPDAIITETLDALEQQGQLNDRAYAAAWADDRVRRQPRSASLVRRELQAQGIDSALAEEVTAEIDDEVEALALAMKRIGRHRGDWATFERRVGAALTRRGFSYETARRVLRTAWEARPDAAAGSAEGLH